MTKTLNFLLALAVAFSLMHHRSATAGDSDMTAEDVVALFQVMPTDTITEKYIKAVRIAALPIFDLCPKIERILAQVEKRVIYFDYLGSGKWGILEDHGWTASVTLQWNASDYIILGQGVNGKPGSLYAHGSMAQIWCGFPSKPKGIISGPLDVHFDINYPSAGE